MKYVSPFTASPREFPERQNISDNYNIIEGKGRAVKPVRLPQGLGTGWNAPGDSQEGGYRPFYTVAFVGILPLGRHKFV